MEFKVRTYKKTGPQKGNKDQEFFYGRAEDALLKHNELFRKEDYSLNPTLWAFSGEVDDWVRYSETDFCNYFTEGKRRIDITKESVNCCNELVVDTEKGYVEAYYELWCDVDQYFGTDTRENESVWINFYTMWHPDGRITAVYIIDSDDSSDDIDWPLTEQEQKYFLRKMEEYAQSQEHLSLQELYDAALKENEEETASASHININGKEYLYGPVSEENIRKYADDNNYIKGIVEVHISDLIDHDLEDFLDIISTRLVGDELLSDINYDVVGLHPDDKNIMYMLVSGDVSLILEDLEDEKV